MSFDAFTCVFERPRQLFFFLSLWKAHHHEISLSLCPFTTNSTSHTNLSLCLPCLQQLLEPSCLVEIISTHTSELLNVFLSFHTKKSRTGECLLHRLFPCIMTSDMFKLSFVDAQKKKKKESRKMLWKESNCWWPCIWLLLFSPCFFTFSLYLPKYKDIYCWRSLLCLGHRA